MSPTLRTPELQPPATKLPLPPAGRPAGVHTLQGFAGTPDAEGVLARFVVAVPAWEDGCYYAAKQKHDPLGETTGAFPNGCNRTQPLRIASFADLTPGGTFLLLQLKSGEHLAVLPIVGPRTAAWFTSSPTAELILNVGTLGTQAVEGDLPAVAWAVAEDAYTAARLAWRAALEDPLVAGSTRARSEKRYPEMFEYLGWCTWEQYKFAIDEAVVLRALDLIEASGLPIRYCLIDDGHLDHTKRQLNSFHADRAKFPNGWENILARRNDDHVRWFGLWLNFNGYWQGVAPQNDLNGLGAHLAPVPSGALFPKEGFNNSFAFYDAMIGAARHAGFDFVKVDDQAQNLGHYKGTAQPVASAANNNQALEAACARHMDGLINCMAHNNVCTFNTRVSAVTRCSEDYKVNDAWRGKAHLHNSFANMMWYAHTVWGDHDMFHSHDDLAGRTMAISKAMSGGPVYLSDDPADFDPKNVWPLCFADGKLLRPTAPAGPLPDSIYLNPFKEAKPYRTVAPLAGRAAAVAVFNLTEPAVEVRGAVSAADYLTATGLTDPHEAWELPSDGLVVFDFQTGAAQRLGAREKVDFVLPGFECKLFHLVPISRGWAVIGRTDKYLSPAGVEVLVIADDELALSTPDAGPVAIWSDRPFTTVDGAEVKLVGDNTYEVTVSAALAGETLRFRRA